jgi:hypothetical protein
MHWHASGSGRIDRANEKRKIMTKFVFIYLFALACLSLTTYVIVKARQFLLSSWKQAQAKRRTE